MQPKEAIMKIISTNSIEERSIPQPGIYPFEVIVAKDAVAKKDGMTELLKLTLKLPTGNVVFDNLISTFPSKTKEFCESIGRLDLYDQGEVTPDAVCHSQGRCLLTIERETVQGKVKEKIKVAKYIAASDPSSILPTQPEINYDVPF